MKMARKKTVKVRFSIFAVLMLIFLKIMHSFETYFWRKHKPIF